MWKIVCCDGSWRLGKGEYKMWFDCMQLHQLKQRADAGNKKEE